jgi:hypothetical protein
MSRKVIFCGRSDMLHDSADPFGMEAAGYWAFAAWAHKARGVATDAFGRWPGIADIPRPEITDGGATARPRGRSV